MSKLSFRARALDASKPLPVYKKDEISGKQEYTGHNRAVPQMPTGMEKEEESVSFLSNLSRPFCCWNHPLADAVCLHTQVTSLRREIMGHKLTIFRNSLVNKLCLLLKINLIHL